MIIQLLFWMAALRSTQYSYSKWLIIVWKSLAFSSLPCSFSSGFPCTASRANDLTIYFWNAKHVMIDVGTLYSYHSKPRLWLRTPSWNRSLHQGNFVISVPNAAAFQDEVWKTPVEKCFFFNCVFNASNWCAKAPPRLKSILCFFMLFLFSHISEIFKKNWEQKVFLSYSWTLRSLLYRSI